MNWTTRNCTNAVNQKMQKKDYHSIRVTQIIWHINRVTTEKDMQQMFLIITLPAISLTLQALTERDVIINIIVIETVKFSINLSRFCTFNLI